MGYVKVLFGKVVIRGKVFGKGLHIGSTQGGITVGGIDSVVVRDPTTKEPYLPGSSLKGKMRMLLEKMERKLANKSISDEVFIHQCNDYVEAYKSCSSCRLFGSSGTNQGRKFKNFPGRLSVRDMPGEKGGTITEVKSENVLDRLTSQAKPRQIERVHGTFLMTLIYDMEGHSFEVYDDEQDADILELEKIKELQKEDKEKPILNFDLAKDDLRNVFRIFSLVELDSLGRSGSRGYGDIGIEITDFTAYTIDYFQAGQDQSMRETARLSFEEECRKPDARPEIKKEDKTMAVNGIEVRRVEYFDPYIHFVKEIGQFYRDAFQERAIVILSDE